MSKLEQAWLKSGKNINKAKEIYAQMFEQKMGRPASKTSVDFAFHKRSYLLK